MERTFVIGDIHGGFKALLQCFERSGFDYDNDRLIALGDVCDGWPQVRECIDELLKVRHLKYIIGNHDLWALDWAQKRIIDDLWLKQGGRNTLLSYGEQPMPSAHVDFLKKALLWVELEKTLFVHAGFDPRKPMIQQSRESLVWDRNFIRYSRDLSAHDPQFRCPLYNEIFVGHTPTTVFAGTEPLRFGNVWDLDTGAGWSGKLTIMNIHSKEYWQSDTVASLYPGHKGRE